jgi:hypothetical protein
MLAGFGWFVDITGLDDATWAGLTPHLDSHPGRMDRARDVAKRAAQANPSLDTMEILNQLVRGAAKSGNNTPYSPRPPRQSLAPSIVDRIQGV